MKYLLSCAVLSAWACPAMGEKLQVPSKKCPTIQAAIDMASPSDEIVVAPGTYYETIDFHGKAVWLHSRRGPAVTAIDGGSSYSVVTCENWEMFDTILEGFTITGGGSYYGGGMRNYASNPTVIDCAFVGNSAYAGGGMDNYYASPTVTNCTFVNNSGYTGAGMSNEGGSPFVTNCMFIENSGYTAGGMDNIYSSPTVTNCTFIRNWGFSIGGISNTYANATLTNCILWNNGPAQIGGDTCTVTYSDIWGGWPGEGNIFADPVFDSTGHLGTRSPCIDAGDSAAVPADVTTDLDSNHRIRGAAVDMGAYESSYKVKDTKP